MKIRFRTLVPLVPWLCWTGLLAGLALVLQYHERLPAGFRELDGHREQQLQLAGERAAACEALYGDGTCAPDGPRIDLFRQALDVDAQWLVPGYTLMLFGVLGFGYLYMHRDVARRFAFRALPVTLLAAGADIAENAFLHRALARLGGDPDGYLRLAAYCSVLKWALIGPLLVLALWVAATLAARAVLGRARVHVDPRPPFRQRAGTALRGFWCRLRNRPEPEDTQRPPVVCRAHELAAAAAADRPRTGPRPDLIAPPMAPGTLTPLAKWASGRRSGADRDREELKDSARGRWRTRALTLPGRAPAHTGICVSGGGIRSASVTLGALQALREQGVLTRAKYLVSVSGGGYTAGAFQLALTERKARVRDTSAVPEARLARPADAFAPGSPEEDHIRRHAKYLADTPREMVLALGAVLRGVLVSLGLLILAFVVAGELVAAFYAAVPVVDLTEFRLGFIAPGDKGVRSFPLYPHAWVPAFALVGLAALVSLAGTLKRTVTGGARPAWLRTALKGMLWAAVGIVLYTVVLPAVVWFYCWLSFGKQVIPDEPGGMSALGAITAGLTWLGGLFVAQYSKTTTVRTDGDKPRRFSFERARTVTTRMGSSWVLRLVTWLVLLLLAFVLLFFLSWTAVTVAGWPRVWQLGLPALLVVLALVLDQTTFSLHPFYRQRLAGAFAVRRAVLKDGSVGALPYDYHGELTRLSTHARRVRPFPKVVFVGSAALSDRNRTAPGRPAVPITFADDYVGGPDIGWVKTSTLENTAHPLIRNDVTVQSAMAVSGAAFASAMGSQSMAVERLFALSNLRLGTWLPNPSYLVDLAERGRPDWTMPRLPRVRRLRYQLQEVVGRYADTSPMLLCTDGGHVDNLGLVELLRLRCRTVYVVDASGDSPPLATTLAQAVTLAYEDLGVRISFPDHAALKLVPGSAEKLEPTDPLAALNARLSASCVVRGEIEYPEPVEFEPGRFERKGTIVVAKASLTPDMPYELLSYALQEKVFPRQSTFDQSFDHAQFDAYVALGHHLGMRAAEADGAE
ncbi:hypothetical protein [Streptomyces sp. NPDC051211]|uniref:hypothetical protein n=1 Tax=Streptomyces sp. NPDC051211 TaxID=3154643 RepID=UPI00344BE82C